jgi:hypothetical protein
MVRFRVHRHNQLGRRPAPDTLLVRAVVVWAFSYWGEHLLFIRLRDGVLFGSDDPACSWVTRGRTITFVGGIAFAMLLALVGGYNIAQLHWNYGIRHGP